MVDQIFPACYVEFPSYCDGKRAPFYLAAEEYIASNYPIDNYLFIWQIPPTVVMGRNQIADSEINIDFCRKNGIDVVRRKSGGGCIYADEGNLMISLITGKSAVEPLFQLYATTIAESLKELGCDVEVSGRNDIVARDKGKICGNAFYHLVDKNIVHGTMLYDTNRETMENALTPSNEKLSKKGVASVRSRIGTLCDFLPDLGCDALANFLKTHLTNRVLSLKADDVELIKAIEADYYDPIYIYGKKENTDILENSLNINQCGTVGLSFKIKEHTITEVHLTGDYFELEEAESAFQDAYLGLPWTFDDLIAATEIRAPYRAIRGMELESLSSLLEKFFPARQIT